MTSKVFKLKYGRWILRIRERRKKPYITLGRWILLGDVGGRTREVESKVKEEG